MPLQGVALRQRGGNIADLPPSPTPAQTQRLTPSEELEELPTVPLDPIPSELVPLESPFENSVIPDDEYALRHWMFDDLVNSVPTSNEDVLLSEFQAREEIYNHVVYTSQMLQQQQSSTRFFPAYAASACNDYSFRDIERPDSPRSVRSAPDTLERHPFTEIAQGDGLHGQDVGQLGTNRDEQTVFNMKRQSTGWFHHLMSIDNKLLPGFHAGTVARLGVGPCAGLHVRLQITVGEFHQPQMHFQFLVRNGAKAEWFSNLIVPLSTVLDTISVTDVSAEDANAMATLRAFEAMDLSELSNQTSRSDVLGEQLQNVDLTNPASHVHLVSSTVRHLRVDINWSQVFVIHNPDFDRNWDLHPEAMRRVASNVRSHLQETGLASLEVWFFPEDTFDRHWRDILGNANMFTSPYSDYLVNVRTGHTDLTFNNIGKIDPEDKPDRSVPPTTYFFDGEHRTVTLLAGAAEEQEMQDIRAASLLDTPVPCVVIADVFSAWEPQDDDLQVYGIRADGTITRFWFVIPLDLDIAPAIPDIGASCIFFLGIGTADRPIPKVALSAEQIQRIAKSVIWRFHLAEQKATNVRNATQQKIDKARENDDNDKVDYLEQNIDEESLSAFVETAAEIVYAMVKAPSAQAVADLPNAPPSVQRAATAEAIVLELRRTADEEDHVWNKRVHTWVAANASATLPMPPSGRGPEFRATRIPPPAGTQANIALFEGKTPKQTNWIPGMVKPYLAFKMPTVKIPGKLQSFLNTMFIPGYFDKENSVWVRAQIAIANYDGVTANIYYKPDATTVMAECDAITAMNSRSEATNRPLAALWWNYSTSFASKPIMLSFLEKFPGLARAYREGQFDGEVQCLVETLGSVPFGWAFITGGPGSGKTTTVMRIVAAAVSGPVEMCKIPDTDEAGDGANDGPAAPQQGNSKHLESEDAEREDAATVYSYHSDDSQQENFKVEFCEQLNCEDVKPKYIEPEPNSDSDDSFHSFEHGKSSDSLPADQHLVVDQWNTTEPDLPTDDWENDSARVDQHPVVDQWNTTEPDLPTDDWENDSARVDQHPVTTTWNTTEPDLPTDDWENDSARVDQHPVATTWNTTEPDLPTNVWETTDEGLGLAPVTKYDDPPALPYQLAPGLVLQTAQTLIAAAQSDTTKVAWTAGQNKLVDDACRRAAKECPDKVVARILPWKREFANLLREGQAEPRVTDLSKNVLAAPANIALSRHSDAYTARRFDETHPTKVYGSISELARSIVDAHPDEWPLILAAREEKRNDPDAYAMNRLKHEEEHRKLMDHAVSKIDIAVGTPVALVDFAKHVSWVAHLIILDEAARLSENLSVALQAQWQSAFCIFIGDTKQFPPIGVTVGQSDFKAVFSKQRQVSLFHRMENAGRIIFRLRKNYRARVHAVQWAQNMFYGDNMTVAHRSHTQATRNFLDWVMMTFLAFDTRSTTLMIRPSYAEESKIGTSFSNPGYANFAMQLVVQLYKVANILDARDLNQRASVLFLTPYASQKNLYDLLLRELTPAEVPKSLVEVRTIDDSPSHEADIIIIDWVRTAKRGFISDPQRMAVALSRARIGTIMIGPGEDITLAWPLSHLVDYLKERDAVIDIKDNCKWFLVCIKCQQPGHTVQDCTFKPQCARCDGAPHSTRNCPRADEDRISTIAAEPITADDGIQRNVLDPPRCFQADTKRVKKNKAERQTALAKPQTQQGLARTEYRGAMRKLHQRQEDDVTGGM